MRHNIQNIILSSLLSLFFFLTLVVRAGALELTVEGFEELGSLRVGGDHYGAESKVEIVDNPVQVGTGAAKLTYAFAPVGNSLSYVEVYLNKPLPGNFGTLGLWLWGNGSGNPVRFRVVDATGECFQYTLGNLDWSGSWQWREINLENPGGYWGGDNDGKLDGPLVLQSILVDQPPLATNVVYFDEVIWRAVAGTLQGLVKDSEGRPVEGARVYFKETPEVATTTNAAGQYALKMKPGNYTLVVTKKGYTSQEKTVTVAAEEIVTADFFLETAPDPGVYSDKANGVEDGLTLVSGGDGWTGAVVEIGGRKAVQTQGSTGNYYLYYRIDDAYLYSGRNDVYITFEYFDAGTGTIDLQYDADTGDTISDCYRSAGFITRTNTNTWKTATFHLADARFANRQNAGADFRLSTDRQPDVYVGKVTVIKAGRVLELTANPSVFSPRSGGVMEGYYRLSSPGVITAWVEDARGKKVVTLAEGREETVSGIVSWAGRDEEGNLVPDGLYYLKLVTHGLAWGEATPMMVAVTVDTQAPPAPRIIEPGQALTVNEGRVLLKIQASAGAKVRLYLDGNQAGEAQADARGLASTLLTFTGEGSHQVTSTEIDPAGNESAPSAALAVTLTPGATIGQVTAEPGEFAPPATTTLRFFLSEAKNVKVVLRDGRGNNLGELLALALRQGEVTVNWDGRLAGETLPDGTYRVEVYDETRLLGGCTVTLDTTPPRPPLLLLPAAGAQVSERKVRFTWEGGAETSQYRLTLWPAGAPEEEQITVVYLPEYQLPTALRPGTWRWRVEAMDGAGNLAVSGLGEFTLSRDLPAALEIRHLQGGPNPFAPNGNGRFEAFQAAYTLTQPANVRIAIYNLAGREVYRREALPEGAGDHYFTWDGRDQRGRIVPPGAYLLVILAENEANDAPARARKLINVLY